MRESEKKMAMKMFSKPLLLFWLLCLTTCSFVGAQDRKKLENEKAKLEREIASINKILSETQKSKKLSVSELSILRKKIAGREALVNNINRQVLLLNSEITTTQSNIEGLQAEIEVLKKEYRSMLEVAYHYRTTTDKLLFIFDADSFNEAWRRYAYFRQYGERQSRRLQEIKNRQEELTKRSNELSVKKLTQEELLGQEVKHKERLASEQKTKQKLVNDLQRKERTLAKQIKDKDNRRKKLQRQIDAAIAKEVARQRAKAEQKKSKTLDKKQEVTISATPEEDMLTKNFSENKGRLPWPTANGVITGHYGVHAHPELKGVQVENLGVDIRTTPGGQVRSVFEGEVCQVMSGPNGKKVVIVRHGNYMTVYTNLEKAFVKVGTKVATKQPIGEVAVNEDKVSEINFQVWKGSQRQNPASWIR